MSTNTTPSVADAMKTEREHAAAREIERLRSLCDDLYSDLLAAGSLTPHDCGAYSLIQETIRLRRDRWARPMQPNEDYTQTADMLERQHARIAELEAELEKTKAIFAASCNHAAVMEMERDARRYRWLRKGESDDVAVVRGMGAMDYGMSAVAYTYSEEIDGDDLDAAIDAAIAKAEGTTP